MKILLLVSIVFLSELSTHAAEAPVRWSVALSKAAPKVGEEIELIVTAEIAPKWIVYSSEFKADLGPQPTDFVFAASDSFRPVGPLVPVAPRRGKDKTWETEYTYFSERAEFRQKVKVLAPKLGGEVQIKGQLCNERDGTCTLFKETLKL